MPNTAPAPMIVGIGEILWDTFADSRRLGGAPANFAYHARSLGADAAVVSCVGDDDDGREIRDRLRGWGLETRHLAVDPSHPTGIVTVRLDEQGVADYVFREGAAWDFIPSDEVLRELADRADAVCFGSLGQRGTTSRATIRRFLDSTRPDCLRVFDVNLRPPYVDREVIEHLVTRSGVLKMNDQELPIVSSLLGIEGDESEVLMSIRSRYDLRLVALTRGGQGSRLLTADCDSEQPSEAVMVVDTVGAGDAFTAALTIGLLRGDPLEQVHRLAGRLAGYVCSRSGGTPELPADLLDPGRNLMSLFMGIDLGTSAIKVVVVDEDQSVRARVIIPIATNRPGPLASEQDPEDWWLAVETALDRLSAEHPLEMAGVEAVGLSGQMHAALLLGPSDRPLRPAILWNDGRAGREAGELQAFGMDLARRVGVPAMAGLTAPKLLWLARNEPATLREATSLLLPKDYIRLRLTGERATDVSDAAGTWLLDQARRDWDDEAIAAVGLDRSLLPRLVEGTDRTGEVRPDLASRFGLRQGVVVAGGAGDTPAGGIGIGAVEEGRGFVSLGTSAQLFVASSSYRPSPERLVHAFCHGVPGRWYRMAAMLNGASVLSFFSGLLGEVDVGRLLDEAEAGPDRPSPLIVLPYLAGERTPFDDPHARGVVFGLSPSSRRPDLIRAAIEGVAFTLADALQTIEVSDMRPTSLGFIGGGARSRFWGRIIASALDLPLRCHGGGEVGPAFGVARLARLALDPTGAGSVLAEPRLADLIEPEPSLVDAYRPRIEAFRRLYAALRDEFRADAAWLA